MSNALKNVNTNRTSQSEKALGKNQKRNNAGGYVFTVNDKTRLERFLILGTDKGSFYVSEKTFTKDSSEFLLNLIQKDENLVAETVKDISVNNRAKKVDPALFATAALFQYGTDKAQAREVFNVVVRTSTHLFDFTQYVKNLGGFGRAKRKAIAAWYESKNDDALAYQLVKYRQRNGWTHKDTLRLSHAQPSNENAAFALGKDVNLDAASKSIKGFYAAQNAKTVKDAVAVLNEYKNLPWEVLPTEFHKAPEVWKTLFENNALKGTALVRNITRFARLGMLNDFNFANAVADRIRSDVATAGIHPISYLVALVTHTEGQVKRNNDRYGYFDMGRQKNWETNETVASALQETYYESFQYVEPANKRTMLALDVSGSMGQTALGSDLSCAQVAGAIAMTVARTEPKTMIRGFTTGGRGFGYGRGNAELTDLGISARTSLEDAMHKVQKNNFGGTDCAQPMLWAAENNVEIDTFVVITDNETWAGNVHPFQALKDYRRKTGIEARLVVLGCSATEFSIADPSDAGMLDVAGFDSAVPTVLADFSAGRI